MKTTAVALPVTTMIKRHDTHRLISSRYSQPDDSVLGRIAGSDAHLQALFELDNATNDRLLAQSGRLPGIDVQELVFQVPCYRIINAAFTHGHPLGQRFSSPERGAWYAAFAIRTAQSEMAFHKSVQLAEIGRYVDEITLDDYLADIRAELHDLRAARAFRDSLAADSYRASQALATKLLAAGSLGVIYPSVRHTGGTCLACFRPALVTNVRKARTYRFQWRGTPTPVIEILR